MGTAVKVLQDAFQGVDPGSDAGQAILTAIKSLSKVAPVSKAAPGIGNEALRNIQTQARQQAPLEMLLRQQAAGGQPGGAQA